jgi:hypothetical protein
MANKTYSGVPTSLHNVSVEVLVDGQTKSVYSLTPRASQRLFNHSPDGFNWGYGGSGPAQLALAILLDLFGDDSLALSWYQPFKWAVIARLPQGMPWKLTSGEIVCALEALKTETLMDP